MVSIDDFHPSDSARGFIRGAVVSEAAEPGPLWAAYKAPEYLGRSTGAWGKPLKDYLRRYPYLGSLISIGEDLPQLENRVDLDPEHVDDLGIPLPRITHRSHPNDLALAKYFEQRMAEIALAAGAVRAYTFDFTRAKAGSGHMMGTCRMGNDPATSVVDRDCRSHEVPNLYIPDGSCFPTSSGYNPTLTIFANAERVGRRISCRDCSERTRHEPERNPDAAGASLSRRDFLVGSAGLWISVSLPRTLAAAAAASSDQPQTFGARRVARGRGDQRRASSRPTTCPARSRPAASTSSTRRSWARMPRAAPAYHAALEELDRVCRLRFGGGFADLAAERQDQLLGQLETAEIEDWRAEDATPDAFFATVRHAHDPRLRARSRHGGNRDYAGWRAMGFPGPVHISAERCRNTWWGRRPSDRLGRGDRMTSGGVRCGS